MLTTREFKRWLLNKGVNPEFINRLDLNRIINDCGDEYEFLVIGNKTAKGDELYMAYAVIPFWYKITMLANPETGSNKINMDRCLLRRKKVLVAKP